MSASNSPAPRLVRIAASYLTPHFNPGMTALHIAAYFGEEEITRELFKHIPAYTTTAQPTRPENALIADLCRESGLITHLTLLTCSPDLTALHLASYSGSENVVRAILNQVCSSRLVQVFLPASSSQGLTWGRPPLRKASPPYTWPASRAMLGLSGCFSRGSFFVMVFAFTYCSDLQSY